MQDAITAQYNIIYMAVILVKMVAEAAEKKRFPSAGRSFGAGWG